MSVDAKALVARFADAFNAHDADAMVEAASPDCVVVAQRSAIEGAFRGHDGVRRWVEGYWDAIPDARADIERVLDADSGRIVVLGRQSGTAKVGGARFDAPLALVVTVDEGLFTSVTAHGSHADALEAAGLSD